MSGLFAAQECSIPTGDEIILLLDGLNELGHETHRRARELREWISSQSAPQHLVVTCRSEEYQTENDLGLPIVMIGEIDETQVRQYAAAYLGHDGSEEFLQSFVAKVDERPADPEMCLDLTKNPFLLTALLVIYANSRNSLLPSRRGELFERLVSTLWEREQQRNTFGWIPQRDMEVALSRLAVSMIEGDMPTRVSIEYALDHIQARTMLLKSIPTRGK
jgi:hypothetical protein